MKTQLILFAIIALGFATWGYGLMIAARALDY